METVKTLKVLIIWTLLVLSFLSQNEAIAKSKFPKKFQKKGKKHGQWKPEGRKEGSPYTVALKVGSFEYENFRNEVGEKIISKKSNELQFTPFKKLIIR